MVCCWGAARYDGQSGQMVGVGMAAEVSREKEKKEK